MTGTKNADNITDLEIVALGLRHPEDAALEQHCKDALDHGAHVMISDVRRGRFACAAALNRDIAASKCAVCFDFASYCPQCGRGVDAIMGLLLPDVRPVTPAVALAPLTVNELTTLLALVFEDIERLGANGAPSAFTLRAMRLLATRVQAHLDMARARDR